VNLINSCTFTLLLIKFNATLMHGFTCLDFNLKNMPAQNVSIASEYDSFVHADVVAFIF
jgi:hypothetical protein